MNQNIFDFFYGLAHQWPTLDYLGVFLADYLQYILGLILLILFFFPRKDTHKNRPMVIVAAAAALISRLIVKNIMLFFYSSPRPFVTLTAVQPLVHVDPIEYLQSFPSGHALFFFSLAMAIYLFNKKLGAWFFLAAILIGIARIFAGVHWPIDIFAGALIGMAVGSLTYLLYVKNRRKFDRLMSSLKTFPKKK